MGQEFSGLDNLTYDLVTLLHDKSRGLRAYSEYVRDAASNPIVLRLLEKLREQDRQSVFALSECLAQLVSSESGSRGASVGDRSHPDDDLE